MSRYLRNKKSKNVSELIGMFEEKVIKGSTKVENKVRFSYSQQHRKYVKNQNLEENGNNTSVENFEQQLKWEDDDDEYHKLEVHGANVNRESEELYCSVKYEEESGAYVGNVNLNSKFGSEELLYGSKKCEESDDEAEKVNLNSKFGSEELLYFSKKCEDSDDEVENSKSQFASEENLYFSRKCEDDESESELENNIRSEWSEELKNEEDIRENNSNEPVTLRQKKHEETKHKSKSKKFNLLRPLSKVWSTNTQKESKQDQIEAMWRRGVAVQEQMKQAPLTENVYKGLEKLINVSLEELEGMEIAEEAEKEKRDQMIKWLNVVMSRLVEEYSKTQIDT